MGRSDRGSRTAQVCECVAARWFARRRRGSTAAKDWIPAFAGMTVQKAGDDGAGLLVSAAHVIPAHHTASFPRTTLRHSRAPHCVIPAHHTTSFPRRRESTAVKDWIPAFAGMTE